ncbi:unnamed protein product [Linum trigynum]|uniref:Uncharacterized protein n=1 Tax=Linum trigynum TaxID=586398 RepID=A0AAV2FWZ5_9ROSI
MPRFEIKKRLPQKTGKQPAQIPSGRVNKVVAAFEAGLSLVHEGRKGSDCVEKIPIDGAPRMRQLEEVGDTGLGLDEYDSNMPNPTFDSRKRSLEHLEGDMGVPPTPKKQFVEADEVSDQVEVASLEWPQPDK